MSLKLTDYVGTTLVKYKAYKTIVYRPNSESYREIIRKFKDSEKSQSTR